MSKLWPVVMLCALIGTPASADPKKPKKGGEPPVAKGFWKILVKPNAHWVMHERQDGKITRDLTVETYDVRKVGAADVARLRWTLTSGKDKTDVGDSASGKYTQVAVTSAGLYILSADMDDAKIATALKKAPSRSDPPKPYEGTKLNHGRYLMIMNGNVCVGEGPEPGAGDCPDTCDATLCISPTDGPVSLMGNWAPGVTVFEN